MEVTPRSIVCAETKDETKIRMMNKRFSEVFYLFCNITSIIILDYMKNTLKDFYKAFELFLKEDIFIY